MYKFLLILSLSVNVSFAAVTSKLADVLVNGGVEKLLAKHAILGDDAKQVKSYMASAIYGLTSKSSLKKEELAVALSALPLTGADANIRKNLQILLDSNGDTITKAQMVEAMNNIIYLANRYGKSVITTCADCVNDNLAKAGFKFGVSTVKNASAVKILEGTVLNTPEKRLSFLKTRIGRNKWGDFSKATIGEADEKPLAIFVSIAEGTAGTPEQKTLAKSILELSKGADGKINIVDGQHKLWRILSDDMTDEHMGRWTEFLGAVSNRAKKDKISVEEAFNRHIDELARGNDDRMASAKQLKQKRCFFK